MPQRGRFGGPPQSPDAGGADTLRHSAVYNSAVAIMNGVDPCVMLFPSPALA